MVHVPTTNRSGHSHRKTCSNPASTVRSMLDLPGGAPGDCGRNAASCYQTSCFPRLRNKRARQTGHLLRDFVECHGCCLRNEPVSGRADLPATSGAGLRMGAAAPSPSLGVQARCSVSKVIFDAVAKRDVIDLAFVIQSIEVKFLKALQPSPVEDVQRAGCGRVSRALHNAV